MYSCSIKQNYIILLVKCKSCERTFYLICNYLLKCSDLPNVIEFTIKCKQFRTNRITKSQLPDSLLFRTLYFQSPDSNTETLNHVTLICLTCKEWVCQVRYHPAGNQPFLSSGDIVNFKQESFPFMVGEGHKIQTTS